jgi:hypothetical protein
MVLMQQLVSFGRFAIPLMLLVPREPFKLGLLPGITLLLPTEPRWRVFTGCGLE